MGSMNLPKRAVKDIYMVNGVAISFYEIERWYAECLLTDRALAEYLGNPYENQTSAELIAMRVFGTRIPPSKPININFNINNSGYYNQSWEDGSWASTNTMNKIFDAINRASNPPPNKPPPTQYKQVDWMKILDISKDAEINEKLIKVSFRKLARKYHPDLPTGSEDKMKELLDARDAAYRAIGILE